MRLPSVAVVIIHWNRVNLLKQFLPVLQTTTYPNLQIVLADNCSDDESVAFVTTHYPHIKVVKNDANYGYAGGYNQALKQVDADYYVLLNNDVEVTPNWIEPIINHLVKQPNVIAAQPKICDYSQKNKFEYAGASGGFIDVLGYAFCRGRIFEYIEEDTQHYDSPQPVFWATGACLFIKATAFHELGGFDENFFAHMEEIDLCWRIKRAGYDIAVVPESVVYHVGGGTLNKQSAHKTYLNFRNNLILLTKNLPLTTLLWLIPFRSFLDLLSSIYFLVSGFPRYSLAIHKAHTHYFFKWLKWYRLRNNTIKMLPFKKLTGVYKGSVVYAHFIKKVNSFSKLNSSLFS